MLLFQIPTHLILPVVHSQAKMVSFSIEPYVKRMFNWYTHNILVKYPGTIIIVVSIMSIILG